jgi:repressor LexA
MVRDSGLYDDPNLPPPRGTKIRTLPVYDLDAAIGKGRLLDLPDYIPTKVGNEVPLSANFGIIISGDSMEPDYHNGQVVWIQQQAKLEHGDVGVFTYEGNTYFKRLRDRVGGTRLQSIDSNYPDIIITDPEAIITLGKVIE